MQGVSCLSQIKCHGFAIYQATGLTWFTCRFTALSTTGSGGKPCCSAFTVTADGAMRRAFQIENSRLSVNKNNPIANVAMQAAFTNGKPWLRSVLNYLQVTWFNHANKFAYLR